MMLDVRQGFESKFPTSLENFRMTPIFANYNRKSVANVLEHLWSVALVIFRIDWRIFCVNVRNILV